jgi:hypothetical protein
MRGAILHSAGHPTMAARTERFLAMPFVLASYALLPVPDCRPCADVLRFATNEEDAPANPVWRT